MPSGDHRLIAKYMDCGAGALKVLEENYTVDERFVIRPKRRSHVETQEESDALDYLVYEFDWAFEDAPVSWWRRWLARLFTDA